ncbi:uncharacterized protein LOC136062827 [Quercus suber]|uniref:uncharacterized protein LOC136062827 n=1 Tax=Quercus suber TaxID=58331 RepID=UPI0032E03A9D
MALKSVDDVDIGGFDDELSTIEIAYFTKNFSNFLRNNNRKAIGTNTVEPRNFRKNDPTKYFRCQGYGYIKSECPTYLRSKGKAITVTLSDNEVSDDKSGCDKDGNFIVFTTTAVVNESVSVEDNPSDVELSEDADLQEAYNKLCKVVAKDAMNIELSLKKIASLEFEKKNLLVKLSSRSKLNQMLSVQKALSDKFGLSFVQSITMSAPNSTNFVPFSSTEPLVSEVVSEIVKPVESGHIRPNCYKLQVAKRVNKLKVPVPQAQDPMALIGELMDRSQSLNVPPFFDGNNYAFWKVRMRAFLCSIDDTMWDAVEIDEFHRISHMTVAKEVWKILETTYEGTRKVKDTKLQMLTTKFEEIKMGDDESFDSFYGKLNEIVIVKLNLGEKIEDTKVAGILIRIGLGFGANFL